MKNTLGKKPNTLEGISLYGRTHPEDKQRESTNQNRKQKRILKNEDNLRDLWDDIRNSNISITGIPGREERKEQKLYLKMNSWAGKGKHTPVHEAQEFPTKINRRDLHQDIL